MIIFDFHQIVIQYSILFTKQQNRGTMVDFSQARLYNCSFITDVQPLPAPHSISQKPSKKVALLKFLQNGLLSLFHINTEFNGPTYILPFTFLSLYWSH